MSSTTSPKLSQPAPAKINLYLRVLDRGPDGYHGVETAMAKLDLADTVRITYKDAGGVRIRVPGFKFLESESNLAVKAARAFFEEMGQPVPSLQIEIDKRIPIGGGLGGGSSDAAAVLNLLARQEKGMTEERLLQIASKLGADVPFLTHPASWGLGTRRGDEITPWPTFPSIPTVLVAPNFGVSTAEAYKALGRPLTKGPSDDNPSRLPKAPKNWSDLEGLLRIGNDLQEVVERKHPEIREIRLQLTKLGAAAAQMSGSGSTVFGFFSSAQEASAAAKRLGSGWRVIETRTAA